MIVVERTVTCSSCLSGYKPFSKTDEEHQRTNTEAILSSCYAEEDSQAYTCTHLADTCLIVMTVPVVLLLIHQVVRDGLSVLHGHLSQSVFLTAILIHEVEDGDDNADWRK